MERRWVESWPFGGNVHTTLSLSLSSLSSLLHPALLLLTYALPLSRCDCYSVIDLPLCTSSTFKSLASAHRSTSIQRLCQCALIEVRALRKSCILACMLSLFAAFVRRLPGPNFCVCSIARSLCWSYGSSTMKIRFLRALPHRAPSASSDPGFVWVLRQFWGQAPQEIGAGQRLSSIPDIVFIICCNLGAFSAVFLVIYCYMYLLKTK